MILSRYKDNTALEIYIERIFPQSPERERDPESRTFPYVLPLGRGHTMYARGCRPSESGPLIP